MAKKFNIEKFSTKNTYSKPELYPLDFDFREYHTLNDKRTHIKSFKMIMDKDYESLKTYVDFENNFNWQNGIMFAAFLGDLQAAKLLIKEVGEIDSFDMSALDYARLSGNRELIQFLSEYELF